MIFFFLTAIVAGVALAVLCTFILWRAINTTFDWFIDTFGRR